ncbi:formyltransferase family protein [Rhodococcus fascians]|jgi:phosphoribosylglycinamide formyltransferase-1|uniref:formyltransferase family protein n=1 Tax=Rhodococcoides fascians TaxID=1828 RepID=UPI0024B7AC2D|nr:formyltransferase family protein [Rhodococcus fascians]MDJ0005517.1 formyltransferase family protein [Rhodococcus fascians]
MKDTRSVLLISDGSRWGELAHDFLRRRFADVDWFAWDYGDPVTRSFDQWHGCDLLLSFKSDFILSEATLDRVRELAVNFHPATPNYRGIGGYRYAIDDNQTQFGATCHIITPKVDGGPIIAVDRFDIVPGESETSLSERTAAVALAQFHRIVTAICNGTTITADDSEQWGQRLYTRRALDADRRKRGELVEA